MRAGAACLLARLAGHGSDGGGGCCSTFFRAPLDVGRCQLEVGCAAHDLLPQSVLAGGLFCFARQRMRVYPHPHIGTPITLRCELRAVFVNGVRCSMMLLAAAIILISSSRHGLQCTSDAVWRLTPEVACDVSSCCCVFCMQ